MLLIVMINVLHAQFNVFSTGLTCAQGGSGERAACRAGAEAKSAEVPTAGTGQQHRAPHAAAAAAGLTRGQWRWAGHPLISSFFYVYIQEYYYLSRIIPRIEKALSHNPI